MRLLEALSEKIMQKKIFRKFIDASHFARQRAQEIGATVTLKREGDDWIVLELERNEQEERNKKKRIEYEDKVREYEIIRRPYLKEREKYYGTLSYETLHDHWNQRQEMDLELDEMELLRKIVRAASGIRDSYGTRVQTCRQCGMVGDSCTCSRSWF